MKRLFCAIGIHFWQTFKEKYSVDGHPTGKSYIYIKVRECSCCGKREKQRPPVHGYQFSWKHCEFDKNTALRITKID